MSDYHLLADATPLTQANKLELGFRQLRKTVERKLGKKEDPAIVKGDTELDSKLSSFHSIEDSVREIMLSSRTLHVSTRAISTQDLQTGRFLNEFAAIDESPVHNACRKLSEAFRANGQQWQGIKEMSERVQQDLNTFYTKGIGELKEEIIEMEEARTDYRAALSWLRATSVDPDKLGQIEKFRRVQLEVKSSKDRFDKLKYAIQTKVDLLRVSRASLLSNSMSPLYKKELDMTSKLIESFSAASAEISEITVGQYDYKVLKELRHDYDGEEENQKVSQNETEIPDTLIDVDSEQIQEDMLLLDISDSGSQSAEGDQLISDFLGSKAVPDNPYYGSDLLSGFMIESMNHDQNSTAQESQNSATQDLLSIFQEHDDAMREAKNNPQGQSC